MARPTPHRELLLAKLRAARSDRRLVCGRVDMYESRDELPRFIERALRPDEGHLLYVVVERGERWACMPITHQFVAHAPDLDIVTTVLVDDLNAELGTHEPR